MNTNAVVARVVRSPGPPYPNLELPLKNSDLPDLYQIFNAKYFGNELPPCKLKWTPLNKRASGKAHCVYGPTPSTNKYLITIATWLKNDLVESIDTLLHEMIHIWQYHKAATTGNKDYLDTSFMDFFLKPIERGHRKYFAQWMRKLNAKGFNVTIEGDAPTELELTRDFYVIVAYIVGNQHPIVLHAAQDPKKILDSVVDELEQRRGDIERCELYSTRDAACVFSVRLTKAGRLPKNAVHIVFKDAYAKRLIDSPLTKLVYTLTREHSEDTAGSVPPEVVGFANSYRKWRNNSLVVYLRSILGNTGFKHITIPRDITHDGSLSDYPDDIAQIIRYLIDEWMGITDIEVKRSDGIKYFYTAFSRSIVLKRNGREAIINDYDIKNYKERWEKDYAMRVDWKRWLALTKAQCLSKLKAEFKKYRKPFDASVMKKVIDKIFLDSGLI